MLSASGLPLSTWVSLMEEHPQSLGVAVNRLFLSMLSFVGIGYSAQLASAQE